MAAADLHFAWVNGEALCQWLGDEPRSKNPRRTEDREAVDCDDCIAAMDMEGG